MRSSHILPHRANPDRHGIPRLGALLLPIRPKERMFSEHLKCSQNISIPWRGTLSATSGLVQNAPLLLVAGEKPSTPAPSAVESNKPPFFQSLHKPNDLKSTHLCDFTHFSVGQRTVRQGSEHSSFYVFQGESPVHVIPYSSDQEFVGSPREPVVSPTASPAPCLE